MKNHKCQKMWRPTGSASGTLSWSNSRSGIKRHIFTSQTSYNRGCSSGSRNMTCSMSGIHTNHFFRGDFTRF